MADYERDESEFLIQHFPLRDVLAFVAARDEVRRIACTPVERLEGDDVAPPASSVDRATKPVASGYVLGPKGVVAA